MGFFLQVQRERRHLLWPELAQTAQGFLAPVWLLWPLEPGGRVRVKGEDLFPPEDRSTFLMGLYTSGPEKKVWLAVNYILPYCLWNQQGATTRLQL